MVQVKDQMVENHQANGQAPNEIEHAIARPAFFSSNVIFPRCFDHHFLFGLRGPIGGTLKKQYVKKSLHHNIADRARIFILSFPSGFPNGSLRYIGKSSLTDKDNLFKI